MTRLDYETPPPAARFPWAPGAAFVTSVAAWLLFGVSWLMFAFLPRSGAVQLVQRGFSVASLATAVAALVVTGLACFAKPRGARLWVSIAAVIAYAVLYAAPLFYA